MKLISPFFILFLLSIPLTSFAWTASPDGFIYNGSDFGGRSSSTPPFHKGPDGISRKGWGVKTHIWSNDGGGTTVVDGVPTNCPVTRWQPRNEAGNRIDCTEDACWTSNPPGVYPSYTGINISKENFFSPKCPNTSSTDIGLLSFGSSSEGIGLISWSGDRFWGSNTKTLIRPNTTGANEPNPGVLGLYNSMVTPWVVAPWAKCSAPAWQKRWYPATACDNKSAVDIITTQQVKYVYTPRVYGRFRTQVQQNFNLVFINTDCFEKRTQNPKLGLACTIEVSVHAMVKGIYANTNTMVKGSDGAQAGQPWVSGSLKARGQTTFLPNRKPAWTSLGAATQHSVFAPTTMGLRITWGQLKSMLSAASTARNSSLVATFGSSWADRSKWKLIDTRFGQENYNPHPENKRYNTYITGNMRAISVTPVALP